MAKEKTSDILPPPELKFHGRIETYYADSEAEIPAMPSYRTTNE